MLVYWNKEEVKARSEKNQVARSKRTMNHLTGKMSFAQVQDKLAKEKGHPPSRAELFDSCYTSKNGNTSPLVSKYLEEIEELRSQLPEGFEDTVGPNDLYAQVTGQDKPGCVRMFGEGVSPSDVWGEVPNRNMCKRVMLEQRSEMLKMKNKIEELQARLLAHQNSLSQSSQCITSVSNDLPRMISSNQHLQVGVHVALKSVSRQGKIVAKGCVHSTNPNAEVGRQVMGENWCQVQVKVVLESEERLIRPYGYCQTLGNALGEMVAWPCDLVTPIE
ncbi:uncharacterized protein LOC131007210 [Salvia miltiorrhiza]|uniref:uncharacterized protein LOC131007210 n=1 Tax=Salvia miltiorrhiza TaxID=226208 RepID=UPI0025ABEF53|nr:uncharacterized protein LOC131007210 [Salvia miltiorrhiza]XP_057790346.1 uncharacterized protein LOC131007210 [Salvia miltiorrhiza]XP_057790348.1 uncharacterized protein LOC131007210 [Salvia miltiorrhiza]